MIAGNHEHQYLLATGNRSGQYLFLLPWLYLLRYTAKVSSYRGGKKVLSLHYDLLVLLKNFKFRSTYSCRAVLTHDENIRKFTLHKLLLFHSVAGAKQPTAIFIFLEMGF